MPRTKLDEPKKIDWLRAAIREQKVVMDMEYVDLAAKAHCNPDYLRKLMSRNGPHSDTWNPEIKRSLCRALGITIKTIMTVVTDNEVELK